MASIHLLRRHLRIVHLHVTLVATAILVLTGGSTGRHEQLEARARAGCAADANPVRCENMLAGDTDWDISGSGSGSIQGFATDMSVDYGGTVDFKIATDAASYAIDIYRMGYYNGAGARKVATIAPSVPLPQSQPTCQSDAALGLVDCGNWAISASWPIPDDAVSGIYFALLRRTDAIQGASHIYFVVRDDTRTADVVFQTSDTTWQAYNTYGGASTYCAPSGVGYSNAGTAYGCLNRAVKVSYNRPFDTRDHDPQSFLFNAEYPMVRFLEANGFNAKYWSGVDTDRRGADLVGSHKPKIFISTGHDEYWSGAQRTHVENARNAGVNLAFFSGNEIYWKHRFESSIVDGVPHRTLVVYKETLAGSKIDPAVDPVTNAPIWTGTWRDNRFSPPADGGRPENALLGQIWTVNCCTGTITVPASMRGLRIWQNTRIAELTSGSASLGSETLGYEWGEALENGHQPAGLIRMSSTTMDAPEKILDFGSIVGPGTATHTLTLYKHNSGALVFAAGTVQWSWGLDSQHDRGGPAAHVPDQAMQQATITLFADMGVQPSTLQIGADPARPLSTMSPTSDIYAPTSTITSPANGAPVESGDRITITGTATDVDGTVAGVEVSVDGGITWRKATGTASWTFDWSPGALGNTNLRSRAVDDSGNIENASAGVTVSVETGTCPCESLFKPSVAPDNPSFPDNSAYELGVKFYSDIGGYITGIRFYKGVNNSGTHTGSLWTTTGERLATATFTNETASGWQEVSFEQPVLITSNTTYIASYHTNVGHYAVTPNYFASDGISSPPLHAPPSGDVGGNGVFAAGESAYPSFTFNAANYWVDVVFSTTNTDTTPPEITNVVQTAVDGSKVEVSWETDELSTSKIEYSVNPAFPTNETSTVTSASFVTKHKLTLAGLTPNTTYFYRVIATDGPGNAAMVQPPTFTLPGPTLRDTAEADFNAGVGAGTYVSVRGNGELGLAPTIGQEFSGTTMPAGWSATPWGMGGFATVGNGVLRVDGSRVGTCSGDPCTEQAPYGPGRSLEFEATFTGDAFQHAGLAVTLGSATEPWAIFSTLSGGNLYVRTNTGSQSQDILLGGTLLGAPHRYRIDWKVDGTVDYYVDGAFVASSPLVVAGPMRPVAASDFSVFGGNIIVNWLHLTPYGGSGTFLSRVFDAQEIVDWNSAQWQTNTPAGTAVSLRVRTGDTATPDETWTPFVALTTAGPLTGLRSRYIQYEASLTSSSDGLTPQLEDIILSTGHAPVAVNDSFRIAENTSRTFLGSGPGSLVFNDTDGDVNDVLRVRAVGAASNGNVVLSGDGSVTYTPNANYSGPDSFVYTVTDGMLESTATVSLDVSSANNAPEANPDSYNIDEDTALMVNAANGILANDQDAENDVIRAVLVTAPSFASSFSLNANGAFTYIPVASFAGPDHFTYRANDGELDSAIVTVTIVMNQVNDAPIGEPDAFTGVINQPLQVSAPGILRNDHDVEVENANPLRAQLVSTTTKGTLTLNLDGSFDYTPTADYLGIDTFTYQPIDHLDAAGNVTTVTLTVAIKSVAVSAASGSTVTTGSVVSAQDPLQSAVTTPSDALIAIAQGVISDSQSPSGYTFLNQQVNIAVINPDGTEVFASPQTPLTFTFTIDQSLLPPGQDAQTFEIFRNGVRVPNCLGATTIPASNLDPCVSERLNLAAGSIQLEILTTHASRWNMGLPISAVSELTARDDGPYQTNRDEPITVAAPGVLSNDFGTGTIEAELFGTPDSGTVTLGPSGGFTFTPTSGFCGSASFAYTAGIGAERSAPATVSITINCDPNAINDSVTVLEDSGATTVAVLTNDSDPDEGQTLRIATVSQGSNGTVVVSPDGTWLTYEPAGNYFGSDSFTYSVRDTLGSLATGTVHVTIAPVNDAPGFVKGANVSIAEDAAAHTAADWATALSAGPGESDALSFIVTTDNPSLFAVAPAVSSTGALTFTPAQNMFGVANVNVFVTDNGGTTDGGVDASVAQSFTITVGAINDPPSFVKGADQTLLEDNGAQTVANWATQISAGPGEDAQGVQFLVAADDTSLFSVQPAISPDGTLTYDPAPNVNGTATISVRAQDDGGTASGGVDTSVAQTFAITLNLVNDPPAFTKGADQTVLEDAAPQSVPNWASGVSAGPADESTQSLQFVVSTDRPELFTSQPAIDAAGTLTYATAADAYGLATINVSLRDDGGTSNGGNDTSPPQSFSITVVPVNDAPAFVGGTDQTVGEDSGPLTLSAWATAVTAGPVNEASQSLNFIVTNDNNQLFSAQPTVSTDGTLTYTAATNAIGSATVRVQLRDDGGTADGGTDVSAVRTFVITITPVNDAPSFIKGGDQSVGEDSGAHTVATWASNISAGPQDEAGQSLTFVLSTDNPTLFTEAPAISADGTLSYTISSNVSGTATISVRLRDSGGTNNGGSDTSAAQTFTIVVTAVNDAPAFTKGASQTVLEDSGAHTIAGWATGISAGPGDESGQGVTFAVSNDNHPLFTQQPAINAAGTLTYALAPDAYGLATISVRLSDDGGSANGGVDTTAVQTFTITVVAVNDVPAFVAGPDQTVREDAGAQTVTGWASAMSAGPGNETGQVLQFIVSNSNNLLFAVQPSLSSDGTLNYTPAANALGSATVTVQLRDSAGTENGGNDTTAAQTFVISLTAVNDAPSFVKGADQQVLEDAAAQSIAAWASSISAGPGDESSQAVTFLVSNDNTSLFTVQPAISADGTLSYAVAPNTTGSATVTVRLRDNGGVEDGGSDTSPPQTFAIVVAAVNDAPVFAKGADQTVAEDSGNHNVSAWATGISAGPADESAQLVTFAVSNNNNALFTTQPAVSVDGTLSFSVAANASGSATVSVRLTDNGGTLNGGTNTSTVQTFTISITNINDAPSFTKGADQTVAEDAGPRSTAGWATAISAGAGSENAQVLSFSVSNNNTSLFSAQPAIAADGTLTFTPAANAFGTATVTAQLIDNGGTANGGVDRSAAITFTITVTAVNDDPNAVNDAATVMEDTAANVISVLANDSSTPDSGETLTVTAVTQATNGAVQIVNSGGGVAYTPNAGFSGTDTFTYSVDDGNGGSATATVTVTVRARPTLRIENADVFEGNSGFTAALFDVNLSHASLVPVTVNYATFSGSARDGRDYVSSSGSLTFAPGETSHSVSINVIGETQKEKDETFAVRVSNATNATIARVEAVGIIRDDDSTPTATMTQANTREGDSLNTSSLTYQMSLSNTSEIPVSVDYTTLGLNATPNVDFQSLTGTLTFGEDETVKYITIPVKGDRQHEALERVRLRLTNGIAMIIQTTEVDGEIEDDDPAPTVSVADVSVIEGQDGTTNAVFKVTLSEAAGKTETVIYRTVDVTAAAGSDYTAVSGTLTFQEGVMSMTVSVPVSGDTAIELLETFALTLISDSDLRIGRGQALATIVNDDSSNWISGTYADLSSGTVGAGASLVDTQDGTVMLQPRFGTEFDGAALPQGWTQSPVGTVTFGGGVAVLDGAQIQNVNALYSNHTLEFAATFRGASQHMGLTSLKFVTKAGGALYAVTMAPRNQTIETLIPGNWLGAEHRFRIDWTPTGITYAIDGTLVAQHLAIYPSNTSMMAVGADLGASALTLNWVRVTPYAPTGEFTSAVYDAGSTATWNNAAWRGTTPLGTSIVLSVRTGDTPMPDASWTPYVAVPVSGGVIGTHGRYAQYRVLLTTLVSGSTPELSEVLITFTK